MSNIINFKKPTNGQKPKMSWFNKVMFGLLIILVVAKLADLGTPKIYREHEVKLLSNPIKVPTEYIATDLSGHEHKMSELMTGKINVFAFWATWCGYCKKEFPEMDLAIPELRKQDITIIPIARGDDTPEKVAQFFKEGDLRNMEGLIATTQELHKALGINGYPMFIAVDENGMAFAKLRPKWNSSNLNELFEMLSKENKEN